MQEIDYYKALGVERPEEASESTDATESAYGENTPSVSADGADSSLREGAKGPEAGAETPEEQEGPENAQPEEAAQGAPEKAEKGQSREENSKYAAARRKAEQERDAAIAKAKEDAAREMDARIKRMGLKNTYTGQPIETWADYEAFEKTHAERKRERFKKDQGMTDEEYQQMIAGLPEVQAAEEKAAQAEQVNEEYRRAQMQAQLEREIAQIAAIDPTVKSVDDLVRLDSYPKIYERVNQGMSIYDAWRLENMDAILEAGRKGAAQQAAVNQAGKEHLRATRGRGAGNQMQAVPAEELDMYRALNPGLSDKDFAEHYNRQNR